MKGLAKVTPVGKSLSGANNNSHQRRTMNNKTSQNNYEKNGPVVTNKDIVVDRDVIIMAMNEFNYSKAITFTLGSKLKKKI